MSFIVKGIDFPEKCGDCPCCVDYDNEDCVYYEKYHTGMFCSAQDSAPDVYDIHEKLNNCPLVEIPTPHGRLIDADALRKTIESIYGGALWTFDCFECIHQAPTIIEAEASELSQ